MGASIYLLLEQCPAISATYFHYLASYDLMFSVDFFPQPHDQTKELNRRQVARLEAKRERRERTARGRAEEDGKVELARAPYVVLGIGFLLMLMALLFNQGVVYIVGVPTGTYVVRGTPVGVFSLVLG